MNVSNTLKFMDHVRRWDNKKLAVVAYRYAGHEDTALMVANMHTNYAADRSLRTILTTIERSDTLSMEGLLNAADVEYRELYKPRENVI